MAKTCDLDLVTCVIGTTNLSGFSQDGDAIALVWDEDIAEVTALADGGHVYSRLNNKGCMVTVSLNQTSPAVGALIAAIEVQHGDQTGIPIPIITALPFSLFDPGTGESYSGSAVIITRPATTKARTTQAVTMSCHISKMKYARLPVSLFP